MPSEAFASPLPLGFASVTWPIRWEPLRMTTLPSALTSWAAVATTGSPGLHLTESSDLARTALTVVPAARPPAAERFFGSVDRPLGLGSFAFFESPGREGAAHRS